MSSCKVECLCLQVREAVVCLSSSLLKWLVFAGEIKEIYFYAFGSEGFVAIVIESKSNLLLCIAGENVLKLFMY